MFERSMRKKVVLPSTERRRIVDMELTAGVISLIAGILILAVPRLLNYIVAIYLILFGILSLFR
jgi:hypothetical protein